MWVFYLISLPLTMGMVGITLWYFAGPDVARYVRFTVGYTWFCSVSIIILVPADIWTTIVNHDKGGISFFWSWSYWSTFLLTWGVVPILQGYEDAGDFTVTERLKTSAHVNLISYFCVGSIALCGLVLLIFLRKNWSGSILGFAMACSNTFGLVTGAILLGFGLSEIPKGIWRNADWITRQKVLSHKVAKMAVKLDDAHQEFSNAIVVAQATSKQMSKRDPLMPFMNIVDKMLVRMLSEDPSFKPQGGKLGESDMDYDTDEKSMATLRRQLKRAREGYYRYKSEYMNFVTEALELEDTMKNYEHCSATGWKYSSSFRPERKGKVGTSLDVLELVWRCILRKQLEKLLAIVLGCMSAAILLAEATILPSGVDLSLVSILINAVKKNEMLVQVAAFITLVYMCVCTYYSLFKIGMLTFYYFTPRQTSSVSLLMICLMVARYAPPISYNFLKLIHLDKDAKTIFENRMGNIDDAVPFFGKGFNKIYPLIMVVYTILRASNFFHHVLDYFGNWKIFRFYSEEADDLDGFDASGLIILQKERSWLEQGYKVGELVVPLARNFNNASINLESGSSTRFLQKAKAPTFTREDDLNTHSKPLKSEVQNDTSQVGISKKYAATRSQSDGQEMKLNTKERNMLAKSSSGMDSTWESMKMELRNFKSNIDAKRFIPLHQVQDEYSRLSSESLDDIFSRIKRPIADHMIHDNHDDLDDYEMDRKRPG
ncbi:LMBR1 domain-containing 2 homolog A-like [Olea europaea subsp. europaea]|uniref:LMBR1 domain-containing 2 homolog A-like n=1 Tax=Olea europaea subsp. europaea TaxID=158383 RepID=A0A8S0SLA6_OLEEU|nr:LMBR1 domain-containing 2 homolog A-like [Olea europaea subsp. europaea]